MTPTHPAGVRSVPVALLAVVTLVAALLAATVASEHSAVADAGHHSDTQGHATSSGHDAGAAHALNAREAAFQDEMRKLWEDHVTWTRLAIVTFVDGSASFPDTAQRLMDNQTDIGDAIEPFYGQAAGNQLTALLQEHIAIAVEILQGAKNGTDVSDAAARWYANGDAIADFLASANPVQWPQATMRAAMKGHLDQTLDEATHELGGQYAASVADYEVIHAHMLGMADVLSNGIMRTFPGQFH
jgi:hypothetical protein